MDFVCLTWELLVSAQGIKASLDVVLVKLCSSHFWPIAHMLFHGGAYILISQMFPLTYLKYLPWVRFLFLSFIDDADSPLAKKDILLKPQINMSLVPDLKQKKKCGFEINPVIHLVNRELIHLKQRVREWEIIRAVIQSVSSRAHTCHNRLFI